MAPGCAQIRGALSRPLYGGRQTRSFCYIEGLDAGLIATMASDADDASQMHLGNPEEVTIAELARQVVALTGAAVPVIHLPAAEDDPLRWPDITLARHRIGFAPRISLVEGRARTIRHIEASR